MKSNCQTSTKLSVEHGRRFLWWFAPYSTLLWHLLSRQRGVSERIHVQLRPCKDRVRSPTSFLPRKHNNSSVLFLVYAKQLLRLYRENNTFLANLGGVITYHNPCDMPTPYMNCGKYLRRKEGALDTVWTIRWSVSYGFPRYNLRCCFGTFSTD